MPNDSKTETAIIEKMVDDFLAAGLTISVNDGDETVLKLSADKPAILAAMFSTDEDYLFPHKDGKRMGFVMLIYGNGADVISDYSMGIEPYLAGANALADSLE